MQLSFEHMALQAASEALPAGLTSQVLAWRRLVRGFGPREGDRCSRVAFQAVAGALADHANSSGCSCYPSVALLAAETGLQRRTVQYALRSLERWSLIRRLNSGKGGRSVATSWALFDPLKGRTMPVDKSPERVHADAGKGARGDSERVHVGAPEGVQVRENRKPPTAEAVESKLRLLAQSPAARSFAELSAQLSGRSVEDVLRDAAQFEADEEVV